MNLRTIKVKDVKLFAQDHPTYKRRNLGSNPGLAFSTTQTTQVTNHRFHLHSITQFLRTLQHFSFLSRFLSGWLVGLNCKSYTSSYFQKCLNVGTETRK